jgi:hypothetical protein
MPARARSGCSYPAAEPRIPGLCARIAVPFHARCGRCILPSAARKSHPWIKQAVRRCREDHQCFIEARLGRLHWPPC